MIMIDSSWTVMGQCEDSCTDSYGQLGDSFSDIYSQHFEHSLDFDAGNIIPSVLDEDNWFTSPRYGLWVYRFLEFPIPSFCLRCHYLYSSLSFKICFL